MMVSRPGKHTWISSQYLMNIKVLLKWIPISEKTEHQCSQAMIGVAKESFQNSLDAFQTIELIVRAYASRKYSI